MKLPRCLHPYWSYRTEDKLYWCKVDKCSEGKITQYNLKWLQIINYLTLVVVSIWIWQIIQSLHSILTETRLCPAAVLLLLIMFLTLSLFLLTSVRLSVLPFVRDNSIKHSWILISWTTISFLCVRVCLPPSQQSVMSRQRYRLLMRVSGIGCCAPFGQTLIRFEWGQHRADCNWVTLDSAAWLLRLLLLLLLYACVDSKLSAHHPEVSPRVW